MYDDKYSKTDHNPAFCKAHALFVSLESKGLNWMSPESLLLVGEARGTFTEYGTHRPMEYLEVDPQTAAAGLADLHAVLTELVNQADDLPEALRYTRARDLIEAAST